MAHRNLTNIVVWLTFVTGALCALPAIADTLHVPSEYPTIQAAIDAAVNSDIVEIADGTYTGVGNRDLDFGGKAITVRSASGDPTLCTIICDGGSRGFYFHNGEGPDSIVQGLTVKDGFADVDDGGGMYIRVCSPTLVDCVLDNCYARWGGGISAYGDVTLINCTIKDCVSDRGGGGIRFTGGNLTLTNCTITGNNGGDIEYSGGGLSFSGNSMTLTNCVISNNRASSGGGITCFGHSSNIILTNCVLANNRCTGQQYGGAMLINANDQRWDVIMENCTITQNVASHGRAWALFAYEDRCRVFASNCILRNGIDQFWFSNGDDTLLTATYSNVREGWPGEGNIDTDPMFVNSAQNDFRLVSGSPCIDAGDNDAVSIRTDLDGNPRIIDNPNVPDTGHGTAPIVDMGAYENQDNYNCPPDWDGNTTIDSQDFIAFLIDFNLGIADYNGDQTTDSQDFIAFLNDFVSPPAGCD